MFYCSSCSVKSCVSHDTENFPRTCPSNEDEILKEAMELLSSEENNRFYTEATKVEADGYCKWPRVKETLVFCKRMGYKKIGIALCMGLKNEAKVVERIFREEGFEVTSVICKVGSNDKEVIGMKDSDKVSPGGFEAMCNPVAQALVLNKEGTEFNIVMGLCLGHDSLFYKYSKAFTTTLIVKDRALGHNPIAAIYCSESYFKKRLK